MTFGLHTVRRKLQVGLATKTFGKEKKRWSCTFSYVRDQLRVPIAGVNMPDRSTQDIITSGILEGESPLFKNGHHPSDAEITRSNSSH